jgi:predicted nucleic acid-binding protein
MDTNALIYLTEGDPALKASIEGFISEIDRADSRIVTSELAYTELLVIPFRTSNAKLIEAYDLLLRTLVLPLPLGREELLLAAKLRATSLKLRTPDALHLATAILADTDVFVTGDRGIDVPAPMKKFCL